MNEIGMTNINDMTNKEKVITPIKNKTQIHILFELFINGERSLSQLSKTINKRKSTIHRNLKDLIHLGLVYDSKREKARGSIHTKYYKVKDDFIIWEKTKRTQGLSEGHEEEKEKKEQTLANIHMLNSIINIIQKPVELLKNFVDSGLEDKSTEDMDFHEFIKGLEPSITLMFLSENQHQKAIEILNNAQLELRKLASQENQQEEPVARPHLFASLLIDMNKLLELQPI